MRPTGFERAGRMSGRLFRQVTLEREVPIQVYDPSGATGTVQWPGQAQVEALVNWTSPDGDPLPVVLSVQTSGNTGRPEEVTGRGVNTLLRAQPLCVPYDGGLAPLGVGVELVVDYAVWGQLRRRVIDARDGIYVLPPCTSANVGIRATRQTGSTPPNPPVQVSASLAPGLDYAPAQPAEPTYSGVYVYGGDGPHAVGWFPAPGVRLFRGGVIPSASASNIVLLLRGGQPSIEVGPFPDFAPPVPDLVPMQPVLALDVDGTDTGLVWLQAVVGW